MTPPLAAETLSGRAVEVLATAEPDAKVAMTAAAASAWRRGDLVLGHALPPNRPARPARPVLLEPRAMPRRSTGPKGRIALIHALAHIELNAIDLAWDIIARFATADLPRAFCDDWVGVAAEEAEHYALLAARLGGLDVAYGNLPAHDGLWGAAMRTADDLAARLALIPMTLEARGLDTTPPMIERLRASGDDETADILKVIYTDEIKHLAVGVRWFEFLCRNDGNDPEAAYREVIEARFPGGLRPPFNLEARGEAGMGEGYLRPWLERPISVRAGTTIAEE
ncbi:MAG: ferritin-like domain-containing protein [Rhodospirillaceae bacterium]|nr:ferritin-like domain-containing protein [Rhodospirillaceae bacterium]